MGEHNSPYFAQGLEDGARDAEMESGCFPVLGLGPDPEKSWSVMYMRGYERAHTPNPCACPLPCKNAGEKVA
jgi:hypothetical protein